MDKFLNVECLGNFSIVRISGEVDLYTAPSLDMCLQELITAGNLRIALDFEFCDYLDSEGIKVLVKAYRLLKDKGELVLCGAKGTVARVLSVSTLDRILKVYPSVDDLDRI